MMKKIINVKFAVCFVTKHKNVHSAIIFFAKTASYCGYSKINSAHLNVNKKLFLLILIKKYCKE